MIGFVVVLTHYGTLSLADPPTDVQREQQIDKMSREAAHMKPPGRSPPTDFQPDGGVDNARLRRSTLDLIVNGKAMCSGAQFQLLLVDDGKLVHTEPLTEESPRTKVVIFSAPNPRQGHDAPNFDRLFLALDKQGSIVDGFFCTVGDVSRTGYIASQSLKNKWRDGTSLTFLDKDGRKFLVSSHPAKEHQTP